MKLRLEHQNIFFQGDNHFFHHNIIKPSYDDRPFKDVEEMNEKIIENWNSVVSKDDVVFYGGDLSFGKYQETKELVYQLNGKIYFIMGNHDNYSDIVKMGRFEKVLDLIDLTVKDDTALDKQGDSQHIVISHYPILSHNRKRKNSFHVHFHTHGSIKRDPIYDWYYKGLIIDAGVNCIDYHPISYTQVKEIMTGKLETLVVTP